MSKQPWRSVLSIHPAAELFPLMSPAELRELGEDIRKHGLREPVVVMRQYRRREGGTMDVREYDLVLIDGRNRLDAMEAVGFTLIRDGQLDPTLGHKALGLKPLTGAYAELDDDVDVYAFVFSRNLHRRNLTAKQKRELTEKWIKAEPTKSNRQIAKIAKVDDKTVGAVRADLERRAEIPHVKSRTDARGRKQPAKRQTEGSKQRAEADRQRIGEVARKDVEEAKADQKPKLAHDGKTTLYCSFCAKSQHDVQTLIPGITSPGRPPACICDQCVAEFATIITERKAATGGAPAADDGRDIPTFLPRAAP